MAGKVVVAKKKLAVASALHRFEDELYKRLNKTIGKVVRDNGIAAGSYANKRMSTNILSIDLQLGGGIRPGCWYTSVGKEQSAKSTLMTQCMIAGVIYKVPFNHFWDFEGSTGTDEVYLNNQFKSNGVKIPYDQILGAPEDAFPVSYWSEDILEVFFEQEASILRRIPDKMFLNNAWWLLFPDNNYGKEMTQGKFDKDIKRQYGKLAVPAQDGSIQGLIFVDSYPAMNPRAMDEDDKNGAGMAIQARCFAQECRKVRGKLKSKGFTVMGVNQIRLRPGFTMGSNEYEPCFPGGTTVLLADGSVDTIRNIVRKKRKVKVLSFNTKTGEVSAKRIIDWKDNGHVPSDKLRTITYKSFDHNGVSITSSLVSTDNHKIWTSEGWVEASKLQAGDTVYLNLPKDVYSDDQKQVIYGSLLGDGVFNSTKQSINWNIHYTHIRYQVPYMLWKAELIDFGNPRDTLDSSSIQRYRPSGEISTFITFKHFNPEIAELALALRSNHATQLSSQRKAVEKVLSLLDLRGLAVWYMDDGHFANDRKNGRWVMTISADRFTPKLKRFACNVIKRLTDADCYIDPTHKKIMIKGKSNCLRFEKAIRKFVHPSLSYKLANCNKAGKYRWAKTDNPTVNTLQPTTIVSVDKNHKYKSSTTQVFDLTIADNHTYFVGGFNRSLDVSRVRRSVRADFVAVSNCGETLRFVSDCRIRCSAQSATNYGGKGELLQEDAINGGLDSYKYVKTKLIKNKIGKPQLESLIRVHTSDPKGEGHGIDHVFDTYEFLRSTGQVSGTKNNMKILLPGFEKSKSIKWLQLKHMIKGNTEQKIKVYRDIGVLKKGEAPKNLRNMCFAQLRDQSAIIKYNEQLKLKPAEKEIKGGY